MKAENMNNVLGALRISFLALLVASCQSGQTAKEERTLRMNQIQVIGSHNSYKQRIEPEVMEMILARNPGSIGLDYYHLPLAEQLDLGLRGLEIDVLHDPSGGRFEKPMAIRTLSEKGIQTLPYDTTHELSSPGLKVLHVPDVDFRTHCYTFVSCLSEIKRWSDEHPSHLPILITINPKDSGIDEPGAVKVLPFTKAVLDSLNREIQSVFDQSRLITPAYVRGAASSLREAVTKNGWPALKESRGKILFVLDAGKEITDRYLSLSAEARVMFANVPPDHDDAGFLIMNEPKEQAEKIRRLVKEGFMIRTRADADTREARSEDYSRFKAAVASGAQLISTDYYHAALSPTKNFEITLDGKFETCNPVIGAEGCEL